MSDIKTKQLIIEISEDLHMKIKMRALILNTSIKNYVVAALEDRLREDEQLK